jgi:N-acyl-D-aspartate/D-glutamate deacylase
MFDVIIRGGEVVDGTGAPRRSADVGISGGQIRAIGVLDEGGRRLIDAEGAIVAPGFIDVHTHYDAQAFFDSTLSPSPLHGITTVFGGNCGFSIAPMTSDTSDYLMRTLARVEGMPLAALEAGLSWDWSSMGEFLGRLENQLSVNAGFLVGHTAVRRMILGEASLERQATDEEMRSMKDLIRSSITEGAIGFSSTWAQAHSDAEGRPVPSRVADARELIELFGVCSEFEGTSMEFNMRNGGPSVEEDIRLFAQISKRAQRPINWNAIRPSAANEALCWERLSAGSYAANIGAKVVGLTYPFHMSIRVNFLSCFGIDLLPGWDAMTRMTPADRLRYLDNSENRRHIADLATQPSPISWLADWSNQTLFDTFAPENESLRGRNVGEIAQEQGRDPFEVLMDVVVRDGLRTSFGPPPPDETRADWEARARILRDPRTVVGGSDAGAHLDMSGSFNYPTLMFQKFVRQEQMMSVEEAVWRLTAIPADLYGLRGRGRLLAGAAADVVIFDEDEIGTEELGIRNDLPGGAGRLYAEAIGIRRVLVAGTEVVSDGKFTEARPGAILRPGRDTSTPLLV